MAGRSDLLRGQLLAHQNMARRPSGAPIALGVLRALQNYSPDVLQEEVQAGS